jgi:hypothetical protein
MYYELISQIFVSCNENILICRFKKGDGDFTGHLTHSYPKPSMIFENVRNIGGMIFLK